MVIAKQENDVRGQSYFALLDKSDHAVITFTLLHNQGNVSEKLLRNLGRLDAENLGISAYLLDRVTGGQNAEMELVLQKIYKCLH